MGRRPLFWCPKAFIPERTYAVLSRVSPEYPPPKGTLPTCYSPVRRSQLTEAKRTLDLHVLSPPLAFALSQDQTLQFDSSLIYRASASMSEPIDTNAH
jgi:hypothetical protein